MTNILMYDWVINSLMVVCAIYILFFKIGILKIIAYDIYIDIIFTVGLLMYFAGSYNGALVASASGLLLSILLRVTRWILGYERLEIINYRPLWVYHPR